MSPTPMSQADSSEPGHLLNELERRQDEALLELDQLENRLMDVLKGLGVTTEEELEQDLV